MPIKLLAQGELRTATGISVFAGGVARPVKAARVMRGGDLVVAFNRGGTGGGSTFTATGPSVVTGQGYDRKPQQVFTSPATVTPQGGTVPYAYAWSVDDPDFSVTSPGMATTSFSAAVFNNFRSATATCIVTDRFGATASVTVGVVVSQQDSQ